MLRMLAVCNSEWAAFGSSMSAVDLRLHSKVRLWNSAEKGALCADDALWEPEYPHLALQLVPRIQYARRHISRLLCQHAL